MYRSKVIFTTTIIIFIFIIAMVNCALAGEKIKEKLPGTSMMEKILIIEEIQKKTKSNEWGYRKKVIFSAQVKNNGEKEIDRYKILLTCSSSDGKELKRLNIVDKDNILPQKMSKRSWSNDVEIHDTGANLLFDTPQTKLKIKVDIQYIVFVDGVTLKRQENGD
ncbi:MAG: hypothetical protein GY707_18530 [Desulfobacteraceae bacterium]|nr:hypothetical protein [Desulfobacteraceae bacterium]